MFIDAADLSRVRQNALDKGGGFFARLVAEPGFLPIGRPVGFRYIKEGRDVGIASRVIERIGAPQVVGMRLRDVVNVFGNENDYFPFLTDPSWFGTVAFGLDHGGVMPEDADGVLYSPPRVTKLIEKVEFYFMGRPILKRGSETAHAGDGLYTFGFNYCSLRKA